VPSPGRTTGPTATWPGLDLAVFPDPSARSMFPAGLAIVGAGTVASMTFSPFRP
jgi:hypothetical protein